MMKAFVRKLISGLITMLLLVVALVPVNAAEHTKTSEYAPPVIGKVMIEKQAYVQLVEANLISGDQSNNVYFTYRFVNEGNQSLSFLDYWTRLESKSGIKYTVRLISKDIEFIPAKSSVQVSFVAEVSSETRLQDLVFQIVKFDFTIDGYEKTLGKITIPNNYRNVVPTGKHRMITVESIPIKAYVSKVTKQRHIDGNKITVSFLLENNGTKSVAIPNFKYYIRTNNQLLYPMEIENSGSNNQTSNNLNPRVQKELNMSVIIPYSIDVEGMNFEVFGTAENLEYPVASFQLPQSTEEQPQDNDNVIVAEDGSYKLELINVQRLPDNDQDIIASEVKITNIDTKKSAPIPRLQGILYLDGIKVDTGETKNIQLDNIFGLRPGASTSMILYTKIPYTFEYETLKLQVVENTGESSVVDEDDGVQFEMSTKAIDVPVLRNSKEITFDDIGRRVKLNISDAEIYQGTASDLYYVELEMTNLESRMSDITKFGGYIQTDDGAYYPATFAVLTKQVRPNGKVLSAMWAELPKGDYDQLSVIIGKGVANGKLAIRDQQTDAYVQAVKINIDEKTQQAKPTLENLNIYPYQLSIRKMYATLSLMGEVKFNLNFEYDLAKNVLHDEILNQHSIILELVDDNAVYEFELKLDSGDNSQGEDVLNLGTGIKKTISKTDSEIFNKISEFKDYTINVYDYFQGHKKLLGSQQFIWFSIPEQLK